MSKPAAKGRCLGVDYGLARVGLAISDPNRIISEPLPSAPNRTAVQDITEIASKRGVSQIVVGLPLNMDGTRSQQTEATLIFISRIRKSTDIPVETWDERLTTVEAERALKEADVINNSTNRRKRRTRRGHRGRNERERVDSAAAAIILQSYLAATL